MDKKNKKNKNNKKELNDELKNLDLESSKQEDEIKDIKIEPTELEIKEKENLDLKDKMARTLAEFDNFRKRTTKEKANMYDDGIMSTVEKLLPIIDNFERALTKDEDENEKDSFYIGMEMVLKQLLNLLKDIGIEEMDCLGKEFDANLHNGVMKVEDETVGENIIVEVMQKGYVFKEKVLRHSMVKVAN